MCHETFMLAIAHSTFAQCAHHVQGVKISIDGTFSVWQRLSTLSIIPRVNKSTFFNMNVHLSSDFYRKVKKLNSLYMGPFRSHQCYINKG